MDKGLTVPKWSKIHQIPQNLSAQFVCPSPKVLDFNEKRLHLASVVRAPMHAFIDQKASFLRDFLDFFSILVDANPSLFDEHFFVVCLIHTL